MKKIFYITNIFPFYRKSIWSKLISENKYNFNIFFSDQPFSHIKPFTNIKSEKLHVIKNYYFKSYLIWQSGVIKKIFFEKPDVVILLGEMNVISNWVISFLCRLLKIKVWFWGHGIYGNENRFKFFLRKKYLQLADKQILYGERAREILINLKFNIENLHVVYNSLDYDIQNIFYQNLNSTSKESDCDIFKIVFIGRLTKRKKLDLLIKAISLLKIKDKINLEIIGDGEERDNLNYLAKKHSLREIIFHGEIFDEKIISKILFNSNLCVSPGNIGLTAIHSLSYGTPVITHNDFNRQMPEAEAIIEGVNGFFFEYDNVHDLADKINLALSKKIKRKQIRKIIEEKYNPDFQKSIFDKVIIDG